MLTPTFLDHRPLQTRRPPPLPHLHRRPTRHPRPNGPNSTNSPSPASHAAKIFYGATCQTDLPNQRFEYMCAFEVPDLSPSPHPEKAA